jgi:hypothetical protein
MIGPFIGEFAFLDNGYRCDILFDKAVYPSVTHAYQACKTVDRVERLNIKNRQTAQAAWQMGQAIKSTPSFRAARVKIMEMLLRVKFKHQTLRDRLVATSDHALVHVNSSDPWWGRVRQDGQLVGRDHLGSLLMKLRVEFMAPKRNILV